MDGAAVEQIAGLTRKPLQIGDFIASPNDWSVSDPAALVKAGPSAKTLAVSTLGAARDYITANKDQLDLTRLLVHVVSPASVHVLGPLDARSRTRETYIAAAATDLTDGFLGRFMSLEDFLIGMQIRFADTDERKRVLSILSSVKHEQVKQATDDGMTQTVQARAGVVMVSEVAVPNPVLLCGIRCFRDIPQPSSLYILRVQSGKSGGLPEVGLFEADGGAWRLVALEKIREWLSAALPAISVLA